MSWVVTRISDGAVVSEFFDQRTVERINREKYRVEDAQTYLARLNAEILENQDRTDEGPKP